MNQTEEGIAASQRRIDGVVAQVESAAQSVEQDRVKAERARRQMQDAALEQGVATQGDHFEKAAEEHARARSRWLYSSAVQGGLTACLAACQRRPICRARSKRPN